MKWIKAANTLLIILPFTNEYLEWEVHPIKKMNKAIKKVIAVKEKLVSEKRPKFKYE